MKVTSYSRTFVPVQTVKIKSEHNSDSLKNSIFNNNRKSYKLKVAAADKSEASMVSNGEQGIVCALLGNSSDVNLTAVLEHDIYIEQNEG